MVSASEGDLPRVTRSHTMKKLLAAAAAVTALTLAAPAQAFTQSEIRAWNASLSEAGVRYIVKKDCRSDIAAFYEPATRSIYVCMNNIRTVELLQEATAHEAIHAAQHCVGRGLGVNAMLPLQTMLAQADPKLAYDWQLAVNNAAERKSAELAKSTTFNTRGITVPLEREAYALESDHAAALTLFRAACLGK
jgi:hypothetical protein